MRQLAALIAIAVLFAPSLARAQTGTAVGVGTGILTGALVAGPVGAVVGGIAGGVIGSSTGPSPRRVRAPRPARHRAVRQPTATPQAAVPRKVASRGAPGPNSAPAPQRASPTPPRREPETQGAGESANTGQDRSWQDPPEH